MDLVIPHGLRIAVLDTVVVCSGLVVRYPMHASTRLD